MNSYFISAPFHKREVWARQEKKIWWYNGEMGDLGSLWVPDPDGTYILPDRGARYAQMLTNAIEHDKVRLFTLWTPERLSWSSLHTTNHPDVGHLSRIDLWSFGRFFAIRCKKRPAWMMFGLRSFVETRYYRASKTYSRHAARMASFCLSAKAVPMEHVSTPFDAEVWLRGGSIPCIGYPYYFYD